MATRKQRAIKKARAQKHQQVVRARKAEAEKKKAAG